MDLFDRTNIVGAKAYPTPMPVSCSFSLTDANTLSSATEYHQVFGSLQYLTLTRLDVAFVVNKLAQFMHQPIDIHWAALK